MTRLVPSFITASAFALLSATAWASPVVVVLESTDGKEVGFLPVLKIHSRGVAKLESRPKPMSDSLHERIVLAGEFFESKDVVLVVWTDPVPPSANKPPEAVVYAVGKGDQRALIEVVRFKSQNDPDNDRVVALKIAALVDDVLRIARAAPSVTEEFAVQSVARALAEGATLRALVRVEGFAASGSGSTGAQAGINVAAGPALRWLRFEGDAYVAARLLTGHTETEMVSQVALSEVALGAGVSGRLLLGRGAIGADVGLGLRIVDAEGLAPDGRREDAVRLIPTARAAAEGRYYVGHRFAIRGTLGVEAALQRQQFSVVGQPVTDLGRARLVAELGLAMFLP